MGQTVEERGGHLCITEDAGPFAERQVRGDDDECPLIETADQMKEQLAAGLSEGQVAEFVEDQDVEAAEETGQPTLSFGAGFRVELVEQVDAVEEAATRGVADTGACDGDGEVGLAAVAWLVSSRRARSCQCLERRSPRCRCCQQKTWMAMAFSQKVRSASMTEGVAVGNARSGKWGAASHSTDRFRYGSPVERASNSTITSGRTKL